jgi:hypothetical protein
MKDTISNLNGLEIVDEKARQDISRLEEVLGDLETILASI